MANTYTQLYIHLVFAVKHRDRLILPSFKDELMKYITGIIQNKGNKLLAINTMPDHCHIFIGLNPKNPISELVKNIKLASGDFINDKKWLKGKFHWQEGYGAFSYSHSQIDNVIKYILNQEKHHKKLSFKEEYKKILTSFNIEYQDAFLFDWFDDVKY
ncbi:Transposase [Ignavibacterium album JCM 16511]|uniref:Transposase n=1 Tax=Ignavibacterium album (strain DSM 19864 / JCM 16511 / NBRC 101810 / Mat9-16) TaxID=945713 RepID=I0ANI4_IGNAJ|nr:IS200/IS605 family transposase [Ignavibacterium album]AFH50541.1 Transposase [Ignavibacterium album JCM 16511]